MTQHSTPTQLQQQLIEEGFVYWDFSDFWYCECSADGCAMYAIVDSGRIEYWSDSDFDDSEEIDLREDFSELDWSLI